MPIYTKKGDRGKTSLGNGLKVWKNDVRVEAYGTIDELNATLGVICSQLLSKNSLYAKRLANSVIEIQDDLFSIGSYLANPANAHLIRELSHKIEKFEKYIDEITVQVGEIQNFTIPGGDVVASYFHVARTIARRAERSVVALAKKEVINDEVLKYINRLSDLLFTFNRFVNYQEKRKETIWKRR